MVQAIIWQAGCETFVLLQLVADLGSPADVLA